MSVKKGSTIVFITDRFDIGGVSTFIDAYTTYLQTIKYKTVIIAEVGETSHNKDYFGKSELLILTRGLGSEQGSHFLNRLYYRINFIIKFVNGFSEIEKKLSVTTVHFNLTWSAISLILFHPRVRNYSLVMTFYGDTALELRNQDENSYVSSISVRIRLKFLKRLQQLAFRFIPTIIAPSQYLKRYLVKEFNVPASKITVIYGGVSNDKQIKSISRVKGKNLYDRSFINLLHISRFEHRKGQDLLLRAMRIVLDSGYKNILLTISGPFEGDVYPLMMLYEQLNLFNHVRLLHKSTPEQRFQLMKGADVFIMCSRFIEGLGMVNIEALACGTPVIGTSVGGIPEIVKLVDPHLLMNSISPANMAKAIIWYIELSKIEKQLLRKKSKAVFLTTFESRNAFKMLPELYSQN